MRKLLFAGLAAATLLGAAGASSAQTVVVERYGHWDPAWGAVPPAPLHRWHHWREHEGDSGTATCTTAWSAFTATIRAATPTSRAAGWVPCRD